MTDAAASPASLPKRLGIIFAAAVILLGAWALIFVRSVDRDLNHDEHQFLAPAALVAREGLQPWRDFPLYHLPNLVFVYAGTERLTGDLVLGAKMVNVAASAGIVLALVLLALRRTSWLGILIALGAVLLLLFDPLFRFSTGKTWNHEVPTALLLAAGGLLLVALRRDTLWLTAAAGMCGGLATGCRLTFAPTLIGLFVFALLYPTPGRRRFGHAATLTLAATLALGPSLYYLATETERFLFSNFEFAKLRLADPSNERVQKTANMWRKIRFVVKDVILLSWPVFLAWIVVAIRPGWQWLKTRQLGNPAAGLWLLLFPFTLAGCLMPLRYQYQHYFVLIPLAVVGTICAARDISHLSIRKGFTTIAFVLVGTILAARVEDKSDYPPIPPFTSREEWYPSRLVRQAQEVKAIVPAGRILTLAPSMPLSADLEIYPEFAAGVFGWRSASLVPRDRRGPLHLVAPEDLAEFLRANPPAAILTGVEEEDEEEPLVEWAKANGFHPKALKKKRTLWVPPAQF